MKKSRNEILYENAKTLYSKAIDIIGSTYDKVFSKDASFKYKRADIYADYDAYLQAALVKVCYLTGKFDSDRLTFIEDLASYGKLLEGADLALFADSVGEIRTKLSEKAEDRLKQVPIAFKLTAAIDSAKNTDITSALLGVTAKIALNFKLIGGSDDYKDNSDVSSAFKSVYAFLSSHGIKLGK
ncbi:MAG: hypothetical protein J5836_02795 [Clostridia bacterium]|nr:hypothetical protein [Clostridia bacterium]